MLYVCALPCLSSTTLWGIKGSVINPYNWCQYYTQALRKSTAAMLRSGARPVAVSPTPNGLDLVWETLTEDLTAVQAGKLSVTVNDQPAGLRCDRQHQPWQKKRYCRHMYVYIAIYKTSMPYSLKWFSRERLVCFLELLRFVSNATIYNSL